jgi:hypothetical protein
MPLNNIVKQCGAKTRSGSPCKNPAMTNGRCRMHNGNAKRGFALPQTKTARWSKDLPARLAARFAEMESDETLLSLRDDIRLIDALIKDKFDKLGTGESQKSWEMMRASVDALEYGIDKEDYAGCRKALREMRDVIDLRVAHYATEVEIRNQLDQRRRMVETEQKIAVAGERAISAEKAMLLVGAIAGILKARVTDANILAAITSDIGQLIHAQEVAG